MFAKLLCWLTKHKRGKRNGTPLMVNGRKVITYRCTRCGATWTRKKKVLVDAAAK